MSSFRVLLSFALALPGLCPQVEAATPAILRVRNSSELQSALRSVRDGGVIEMAAGTYAAPARGFGISNARKGFTVRAAARALVVLDGNGRGPVLRYRNNDRTRGKLVVFQGLTFRNGLSTAEGEAGGVTVSAAEARFVDCAFLGNVARARSTGGGAMRVLAGSEVTVVNGAWRDNSSPNRGGALEILSSAVTIQGGEFTDNRTNLPGHKPTSPGGAVWILNGSLLVSDVRFERNQAGWTGGAIFAFGHWTDPETVPRTEVTIVRSTFVENQAVPDPCCALGRPTSGGALHAEDQATLRIDHSHFLGNAADMGGAVDAFRAVVEVNGSLFYANRSLLSAERGSAGGAIFLASSDGSGDGLVNRRPGRLSIRGSLLQGSADSPEPAAHAGGCLAAAGDESRLYGTSAVPAMGSAEENRARVELREVVFANCAAAGSPRGPAFGGAVQAALVDLVMEDSLVFESDARGDGAGGGALALQRESMAAISRTTFARNTAQRWGGALFLSGSTVQIDGCDFLGNDVVPGVSERLADSRGAAILAIPLLSPPERAHDVGGVVSGSRFIDNLGVAIWDIDPPSGPVNAMRYDGNQILPGPSGDRVYVNSLASPGGADISELNGLTVFRSLRPATDKSLVDNVRLFSAPALGTLLAVPPGLGTGAPGSPDTFLAYAWAGRSATLGAQPLTARSGLLAVSSAGTHTLTVDGTPVASAEVAASSCTGGSTLCLGADEVLVEVRWRDAGGRTGAARAVRLSFAAEGASRGRGGPGKDFALGHRRDRPPRPMGKLQRSAACREQVPGAVRGEGRMDHPVSRESLEKFAAGTSSREENRAVIAHLLKGCSSCSSQIGAYLRPEIAADAYDAVFERLSGAAVPVPQGGKVLPFAARRRAPAPVGRSLHFRR